MTSDDPDLTPTPPHPPTDGETDPPYVPDREVFGAHTHQELWDLVHEALDPGALGQSADAWRRGADLVGEAFRTFADSTNAEFGRWGGQARDAALEATREFAARGSAVSEVCAALHRLLEADAEAAQVIRDAIPPPPPPYQPLEDPASEAVHGGRRRMEYEVAAAAALADARDVMTYVYNPTLPASGDRVPRFTPAPRGPGSGGGRR
ncbi:hypothetical protein BJY24_003223 [Nocardia transvalensis]|uniref:PPE family protein n=1 Tax=Nocardia transvalensis TaxID=37333 RepID=A0A7W9UIK2_9NOCA|nr:hypothetical protein [Nocardia transvalensis]MBB5914356.1 hypothetical protein [Nocardia transvalensis]